MEREHSIERDLKPNQWTGLMDWMAGPRKRNNCHSTAPTHPDIRHLKNAGEYDVTAAQTELWNKASWFHRRSLEAALGRREVAAFSNTLFEILVRDVDYRLAPALGIGIGGSNHLNPSQILP